MNGIVNACVAIANWFWAIPILVIVVGGGLYVSIRLGFPQITKLRYILSQTFGKALSKNSVDGVSPFAAACSALASSIGASNIVGVPVAIALGGPGAVFWMWMTAIVGCCTKYVEIALCMKYREKNEKGEWLGGLFSYIKELFGGKKLGMAFGMFAAAAAVIGGIPSIMTQTVSAVSQTQIFGLPPMITGAVIIVIVSLVVFGGIKRIASVMEKMIPIMASIYIVGVIIVLCKFSGNILPSLASIFSTAFTGQSAVGGFVGSTVTLAIRWGCARGVYSNEAGFGSAPIAHCTATVDHPIRQAMWGVFEVCVDTIIVCTATALAVLVTGVWKDSAYGSGALAQAAFHTVFGAAGDYFVALCVFLFVITTIIVVIFYNEREAEWLFKSTKAALVIRIINVIGMIAAVCGIELTTMYALTDFFIALYIVPNMIAVVVLVPEVIKLQKEFFNTPGKYYLADMAEKTARKKS